MSSLLVDVGNSRIKWAVWEKGQFLRRGHLFHKGIDRSVLGQRLWDDLKRPARVVIANVAGSEMREALAAWIRTAWSVEAQFVSTESMGFGIRNAYAIPQQMGVDRWVAMIGANKRVSSPCCVVDCGTAVTIDALSRGGIHLGGVIIPGIRLMRESLYRDTRQIPAEDNGQTALFGQSTRDCVWGGTAYAVASAIDGIARRMEKAMKGQVCRLLTGGDAEVLLAYLEDDFRHEPDLIFWGLLVMANQI